MSKAGGNIQDGGGLGINGLPNSLTWGIDFYNNSASQDSNSASYNPAGFGDSSLGKNPTASLLGGSDGNQVMGWRSTGISGLLNSAATVDDQREITSLNGASGSPGGGTNAGWTGSNGTPNISATVTATYVYQNNIGTLCK